MTLTARRPRIAVAVFPGTWSERDFVHVATSVLGWDASLVWHAESDLGAPDAVVLPGGFAHGDHLRTGAVARFSPIMRSVEEFAAAGGPVIGSCNGFQILTEAGSASGRPHAQRPPRVPLRLADRCASSILTAGPALARRSRRRRRHPPADQPRRGALRRRPGDTLDELERDGRVVLRYADADGRVTRRRQPERLGAGDRRHRQRARKRARPHAAPRACRRGGGRRDRWRCASSARWNAGCKTSRQPRSVGYDRIQAA